MRLPVAFFLALLCTVQSAELLALIAPDDCAELLVPGEREGDEGDDCPQECARCVCCARRAASLLRSAPLEPAMTPGVDDTPAYLSWTSIGPPRDIFHVPRTSR
jgi:hypothetical protein